MPVYSAFVDNSPKYIDEAELLVWSLVQLGEVRPSDIVLHTPYGFPRSSLPVAHGLGVRVREISSWAELNPESQDRPHYNKIVQLLDGKFQEQQDVVLLDCDVIATRRLAIRTRGVSGKPADVAAIDLQVLQEVFGGAGVKLSIGRAELDGRPIPKTWLNTGFLAISAEHREEVGHSWAEWARWLAKNVPESQVPKGLSDEIALALALAAKAIPLRRVGPKWNFVVNKKRSIRDDCDPVFVHYRGHFARNGVLRSVPKGGIIGASPRANRRIKGLNRRIAGFREARGLFPEV